MYLRGSKWSMNRRKRTVNPFSVFLLLGAVGLFIYVNQVLIPSTPPLFIPTPTSTTPPESYIEQARALTSEGKFTLAIDQYKLAITGDPQNPVNYIELARIQIYNNDYPSAQLSAENALLLNQDNPTAHVLRGWSLGLQGDYVQAEGAINRAIALDPNNAFAHAIYAEILALRIFNQGAEIGMIEKASEESRKALDLDPNLMEAYMARAYVLEATQNNAEAIDALQKAIQLNKNVSDLYLALGRNYYALQQYDQAIEAFTRANTLNPENPDPDSQIAAIYFTNGDYARAAQFAETAVNDDPTNPFRRGNLGRMYYYARDYESAVRELRLAVRGGVAADGARVEGLPLDYGRVSVYYSAYGLALARLGECTEAVEISQVMIQTLVEDEIAVYNAQEMINICQAFVPTATSPVEGEVTPTP